MNGFATPEETQGFAQRFAGRAAEGHFREAPSTGGLVLSSIGLGTYLGEPTEDADRAYTEAVVAAVRGGINVVDSAINYRFQRSERSIGAALKQLAAEGFRREELVLCTKGGYLTTDGEAPSGREHFVHYVTREFLDTGIATQDEIVDGVHCMAPRYLENQIERSRSNLGVDCIDVYYLHNPESQLTAVLRATFAKRIRAAFEFLETTVAAGKIRFYGMATWNGFRLAEHAPEHVSLAEMVALARDVAGDAHHFRFVQLPFNLAMPEALVAPTQTVNGNPGPMVEAAYHLGITLVASASLLQGQLAQGLPSFVQGALGLESDRHRALQFARSTPGITTALVGMGRPEHVADNLKLVGVPPASQEQFMKLFERGQ